LLYVGRLSAEKGIDCLIKAAADLKGVPLRIVGDGPQAERLKALATTLESHVIFDGWVDSAGVRARMAKAELLCVPSIWYENCPGVVLEAMVAGLPIVASDLGGLPELLEGGQAGWLAPAGDAGALRRVIRRALDDKARTARQASRALSRVLSRHDPDRFVSRMEGIYRSLETPNRRS
jgi:glycosyltransferase involved in cell wall biosynthesis